MNHKWMRTSLFVAVGLALALLAPAVSAGAKTSDASDARSGTAGFHRLDAAKAAGYGLLTDAAGIACIDNPGVGGMGIHYANGNLVGNPSVNAATPEALVYEPQANGRLRLVAAEYVVLQSAWEAAGNSGVPTLFGQPFALTPSPNRFGLSAFYELHAWIWKHNPRGMVDDWNPDVGCAAAQS